MSLFDAFRYDGKRVLVVGGATGMGAAVAELAQDAGAEVVVMDRAPVTLAGVKAISLNLAERESIDAALDECGGPINALFSCAGVADGTPGIERINFIGHRYLIDRMIEKDLMPRGSAIGLISSAAGLGWQNNLPKLNEYLDITDWDGACTTAGEMPAACAAREAASSKRRSTLWTSKSSPIRTMKRRPPSSTRKL
jgi:NAD(P)-dependent dehydrogenase (short-subunit alcohol dehydrogenase family)